MVLTIFAGLVAVMFVLLLPTFILAGLFAGFSLLFGKKRPQQPVAPEPSGVYGTQGFSHTDAHLTEAGLLGHGWGEGIPVCESLESGAVLRYCGENSLTCFGPPGAGKFTDLIARAVIECAATRSQFIIDASGGQIAAGTIHELRKYARVIAFSPFSEGLPPGVPELLGPSRSYNPMRTLLDPSSTAYGVQCDGLAEIVIPDVSGKESANGGFFTGRARGASSGVIMQLRACGKPEEQNLAEVARIILTRRIFALAREVMKQPKASRYVKDRLGPYAAPTAELDRTINSVLQTADEGLSFLSNEAISNVVRISSLRFEELKHGPRPTVVIVTMPVTMLRKCRGWFGMLISSALQELNSTPRGRWPVLMTIDEFGILPRQPLVELAYAESRKRGVQLFCFLQHTGQALEVYGENGLKNFESGSDVLIYLPPRDLATAQAVSERAGRGTVVVPQYSYSHDLRRGHEGELIENLGYGEHPWDVLTPQQVMSLGRNRAVMFTPGSSNAVIVGRRPWFDTTMPGHEREEHAELRRRIGADPYHRAKA